MTKHCPRCDEDKELDEFGKNRKEKSGFATYCKPCTREKARQWKLDNPEKVASYKKRCSRCHFTKAKSLFGLDRSRPGGRHPLCKLCRRKETRDKLKAKRMARWEERERLLVLKDQKVALEEQKWGREVSRTPV